jgi:hypothetical protein
MHVTGSTKAHLLPLHLAFDNGHMEVVELLVQRGSCIDSTDPEGNTVFLKAAKSCRLDKMRQLLSLGASAKCVNKKKETALHLVLADETRGPAAASDYASTHALDCTVSYRASTHLSGGITRRAKPAAGAT